MTCHNGTDGCVCGLDPSLLCARCQAQMEIGVWWQREGEAREHMYKLMVEEHAAEIARLKADLQLVVDSKLLGGPETIWELQRRALEAVRAAVTIEEAHRAASSALR